MAIRKGDSDREFRERLKNPLKPINDTSISPEMEDYLKRLDNNDLKEENKKENVQVKRLFCPTCRKPTLKRHPQGFACGFCGLFTNSPLRMAVDEAARKQNME